jgi:hypothetical protein
LNKSYFLKDTALINKEEDAFHHHDYVKNIKKIIEEHNPPFNIALIGKWGVGKSSIINILKSELDAKDEYLFHEINAWKYENDSLKKAFLKSLWLKLNGNESGSLWNQYKNSFREFLGGVTIDDKTRGIKETIKELLPLLTVLGFIFLSSSTLFALVFLLWDVLNGTFTENTIKENIMDSFQDFKKNMWVPIIITPLYKMFQDFLKSSIQQKTADIKLIKPIETSDEYEELFKEEIKKYKDKNPKFRKFIVVVDDLDRLSARKVVAALDAIKAFVDVDECIFIVACDENILIRAIEKEKLNKSAENIDGELFLDKLFHFRMSLPPIIESDMVRYASNLAKQEAAGLVELCEGNFDEIVNYLIHAEVTTPRQVKKLLNAFANNLLIAKAREDGGKKLEDKLLTGEQGLKFLAKLSVIQSDYNDIYLNLTKDFSFLDDLLEFYYSEEPEAMIIKPTIKRLFERKESTYKLKLDYQGLVNFLIATQHITVENMAPFIYLGQDAIGLMAGDEKQRNIQKSLVSGNEKGVLITLEQEQHSEHIALVIIDIVKNCKRKDLFPVLKAAYQLIDHIPIEQRTELANAIVLRLTTVKISEIRFWQIELRNLFSVYVATNNKEVAQKTLLHTMDQLFSKSSNWKTNSGKDMSDKEFVRQITNFLDFLLTKDADLPEAVQEKIKKFLSKKNEIHDFYPFEEILNLYRRHPGLFGYYFDLSFYFQLLSHMEKVDEKEWEESLEVFWEVVTPIRDRYKEEFINTIHRIIDIVDLSIMFDIFDLLEPVTTDISSIEGAKIINAAVNNKFEKSSDVIRLSRFIKMIKFDLNVELGERLDTFIENQLHKDNDEVLEEMSILIDHISSLQEGNFKTLSKVASFLLTPTFSSSLYDRILEKNNKYFTDTQRRTLFGNLIYPINNYNATSEEFNRLSTLYVLLRDEESNHSFIREGINQGISYFTNNGWYQYQGWANGFIKLLNFTSTFVDKDNLVKLVDILLNISHSYPDLTLKGLVVIGEYIPEERMIEAINVVYASSTTDANKVDAFYLLKSIRDQFTEENYKAYTDFLINNIYLEPKEFLDELYSQHDSLTRDELVNLINRIAELGESMLQENEAIVRRTVKKFYIALTSVDEQYEILEELLQSNVREEKIRKILLESVERNVVAAILSYAINPEIDFGSIERRKKLISLCSNHHAALNKSHLTRLIVDMMREKNDEYIQELCDILIVGYNNFKFGHEKRHVSSQIVPLFRSVNMITKEKVLDLAKLYDMTREFEQAIRDGVVSGEETELIGNKLFSKKKRIAFLR